MNLLLFMVVSLGCVNIIQNETIFSFIREFFHKKYPKFYGFLKCPTCFGFWFGVLLSFFIPIYGGILNIFFGGVVSSIINNIYAKIFKEKYEKI